MGRSGRVAPAAAADPGPSFAVDPLGDEDEGIDGTESEMLRVIKPVYSFLEVDPRDTFARRLFGRWGAGVIWQALRQPAFVFAIGSLWLVGSFWLVLGLVRDVGYPYVGLLNTPCPVIGLLVMNVELLGRCLAAFETRFVMVNALLIYAFVIFMMEDVRLTVAWTGFVLSNLAPLCFDALPVRIRRPTALFFLPCGLIFTICVACIFVFGKSMSERAVVDVNNGVTIDLPARLASCAINTGVFLSKNIYASVHSAQFTILRVPFETVKVPKADFEGFQRVHDTILQQVASSSSYSARRPRKYKAAERPQQQTTRTGTSNRKRVIGVVDRPFIIETNDTLAKRFLPASAARAIFWAASHAVLGRSLAVLHVVGLTLSALTNFDSYVHLWLASFLLSIPTTVVASGLWSAPIVLRLLHSFDVKFLLAVNVATVVCVAIVASDWRHVVAFIPVLLTITCATFSDASPAFVLMNGRTVLAVPSVAMFVFLSWATFTKTLDSQTDVDFHIVGDFTFKVRDTLGGLFITAAFLMLKNITLPPRLVLLRAPLRYVSSTIPVKVNTSSSGK